MCFEIWGGEWRRLYHQFPRCIRFPHLLWRACLLYVRLVTPSCCWRARAVLSTSCTMHMHTNLTVLKMKTICAYPIREFWRNCSVCLECDYTSDTRMSAENDKRSIWWFWLKWQLNILQQTMRNREQVLFLLFQVPLLFKYSKALHMGISILNLHVCYLNDLSDFSMQDCLQVALQFN